LTCHVSCLSSCRIGTAPDTVKRLVDRFDRDRKVFLSGDCKEEQLRLEFLNPFFTALGWDMDNNCEPDNSEFRMQRAECRVSGHFGFCVIRPVTRKGLSETFKQVISAMPADVLGQVHERFLAQVKRLTVRHQAVVEGRSRGLVPTRALDGSSAPRKLSAMPCEPRPVLTE